MCDSIVLIVALPVGYSLITNLPGNVETAFSTSVLCSCIWATDILVKQASYLLPTYASLNSNV